MCGRGERLLEHAEDAQDLVLVALDRAQELLAREEQEPPRLAEVRAAVYTIGSAQRWRKERRQRLWARMR